jgi:5'-nucleotidase
MWSYPMPNDIPQILLTNDDGIQSPGLWSAASALEPLGFVHVVAPREQCSGTGRSFPTTSDGIINTHQVRVNGKEWTVYAVGGTPSQAVLHGALEILPRMPDLLVSGINYGANLGTGITVSGTVGAALEAAAIGVPAMAISLETEQKHHHSYSREVDFSTAAHFVRKFGKLLLETHLPEDVNLLKVDIPACATPKTPWEITRISPVKLYRPVPPERNSWTEPGRTGYTLSSSWQQAPPDTDIHAVLIKGVVSVTPLSLDMTSRIDRAKLETLFRQD